ncbi:MAG: hypothetical protein ACFFBY_03860 [Promethearchaeota archaeon]
MNPSKAQTQAPDLQINTSLILTEYANNFGEKSNDSSVNIDIPSSTWNLSSVVINFTSIKMGRETVTIEDQESGFETIRRNDYEICGMQLNITEQCTIFAVDIFGYKYQGSSTPGHVYVRIEGWNSISHRPDGIVYGQQVELNISLIPSWYTQTFDSPIVLSPGYYCLVIDGSDADFWDRYYWYINNQNENSSLYMCRYDDHWHQWENRFGDVFLHRIKQQVNKSYYPEEINMTARIGDNLYQVQNGGVIGIGEFSASNLNFCPESYSLNIFISNNISVELLLNYNFRVSIHNNFIEKATGLIRKDSNIQWILQPSITRFSYNYSMTFNFPNNWDNFSVLRNSLNITSQVSVNYSRRVLYLPNMTIINGASWEILSSSPNINFPLNVPKDTFGPQQNIFFSIQDPAMPGNYTIFLYNSLGFLIDSKTLRIPGDPNLYQYSLSANPEEGIYMSYAFWNNATDAGLVTYEFHIEVPFTISIEVLYGILILLSIIIITTISSFTLAKRTKRIKAKRREKIYNEYMDALNIDYFIVSDKNSGLCLYDQIIAGEEIDSTLVSGFLQAIRGFGIELTKSRNESQTIKLEYQDSKILMSEFKDVRLVFIMKGNPSEDFIKSVDSLSLDIDDRFGKSIEKFDGDLSRFQNIRIILEKHLQIALIYPLKVGKKEHIRITQNERSIINRALKVMEQRNSDHFYVSSLFEKKSKFQVKDAEDILKLINKKIFVPIVIAS